MKTNELQVNVKKKNHSGNRKNVVKLSLLSTLYYIFKSCVFKGQNLPIAVSQITIKFDNDWNSYLIFYVIYQMLFAKYQTQLQQPFKRLFFQGIGNARWQNHKLFDEHKNDSHAVIKSNIPTGEYQ